jgi:NAD(P)H-flavin reductase
MHYCEDRSVYACGAPASARSTGRWFCEKHLAQAERDYENYLRGEHK